jgi:hypothetical protein
MNEEKPSETKVDGRPFDNSVGPTVQALDGVMSRRSPLSAQQICCDNDTPSWKTPHEKHGISTAALVALVILAAVVLLVVFRVTGVI